MTAAPSVSTSRHLASKSAIIFSASAAISLRALIVAPPTRAPGWRGRSSTILCRLDGNRRLDDAPFPIADRGLRLLVGNVQRVALLVVLPVRPQLRNRLLQLVRL